MNESVVTVDGFYTDALKRCEAKQQMFFIRFPQNTSVDELLVTMQVMRPARTPGRV